jgi:hypothetical protein
VRLPRNRKVIAGLSIWGTASLFTLAIYVSHVQMSVPIFVAFCLSVFCGGFLFTWGAIEAIKQKGLGGPTRV